MSVETPSLFSQIIQDHLALKERNAPLENSMPIGRYKSADPFDNHPLFKTEEQARIEDTMDGNASLAQEAHAWPGEEVEAHANAPVAAEDHESDSGLWSRSRDFDWGD
jgi:hypothetical protein